MPPSEDLAPSARDVSPAGRPAQRTDESGRQSPEPARRRRRGGLWLLLVALLLAGWASSCVIDIDHPLVAAAAALSPAITVIAVPVVALGVGRRHPLSAAVATIAAAVPWVLVAGYGAAGPGRASGQGATTLRVMTVNANGGQADPARVAELAREYDVGVVVVTELTGRLAHDLTGQGLNAAVTARYVEVGDDTTSGIGVWTRGDLTDPRPVTGLSRTAASGVLQTNAGPVGLLVTHAAGSAIVPGQGWHEDLRRLPELAPQTDRRIMLGDFNATPWNPAFRRLASGEWRDSADVVGRGLRPTWPSWTPLPISPLDHVLVAGDLGVSDVETATVSGTDHRALIVSVVVPG